MSKTHRKKRAREGVNGAADPPGGSENGLALAGMRTSSGLPRGLSIRITLARQGVLGNLVALYRNREVSIYGALAGNSPRAEALCREWLRTFSEREIPERVRAAWERLIESEDVALPQKG